MKYANIVSGEFAEVLPACVRTERGVTFNPTPEQWREAGWREVRAVAAPAPGFRVIEYGVKDLDGVSCEVTIARSVSIAAAAAAEAERAADTTCWTKREQLLLRLIFLIRGQPAGLTAAGFKAWVRSEWEALR